MTTKEQEAINNLVKLAQDINNGNNSFREEIKNEVINLTKKVEAKHSPIQMEENIVRTVQQSINSAMTSILTGYDSPLKKLMLEVINSHSIEIKQIIDSSFSTAIRTEDFKQEIVNAFSHKIARTIISNNEGLFDKVSNELKQDAIFKSKMAIAVSNVVEECLKNRNS